MKTEDILDLYKKERMYQRCSFGEYEDIKSLNFASFILFIETYLERVKQGYSGKWDKNLPSWLESCKELKEQGSAPVQAYEDLIKVMTLAGAALETFTNIDPNKWRENPEEECQKWKS